jgi:eukaryotic-like serine/threonine-protein kinase
MIRSDGLIKILDFGLVKLANNVAAAGDVFNMPTQRQLTTPGIIMGTAQYMSPEQARAQSTDARTDIWSLGCVIYEMACGQPPFAGETSADLIAEIVKAPPVPLRIKCPNIPKRMEEIIRKTLEKAPDNRYQTAKELLADLKQVQRSIDANPALSRANLLPAKLRKVIRKRPRPPRTTDKDLANVSSAEYLIWGIKAHWLTTIGIVLFVLGLLGATAFTVRNYWRKPEVVQQTVIKNPTIDRLTGDGKTQFAAISPNGKVLAYVKSDGGQFSLWVKQLATNSNIQLVAPGAIGEYDYLTFDPEGDFVYFTGANHDTTAMGSIFRVPVLGGAYTEVLAHAGWPSFSPDGGQIVFHTEDDKPDGTTEWILEIVDLDGANRRRLASTFGNRVLWKPSWSPDGKLIACGVSEEAEQRASVLLLNVENGSTASVFEGEWRNVRDIAWRPNMDGILVEGLVKDTRRIWEITLSTGQVNPLTQASGNYTGVSLSADGRVLVSAQKDVRSSLWISPNAEFEKAVQVTSGKARHYGVTWAKDKRIIFSTDASGNAELWSINADGSEETQLTNEPDGWKIAPLASRDGRYVFYSEGDQRTNIWRRDTDGSRPVQLTTGDFDVAGGISSEGNWLIYAARSENSFETRRVSIDGGQSMGLSAELPVGGSMSPDGKSMAGMDMDKSTKKLMLKILPMEDGGLSRTFKVSERVFLRLIEWTPDGRYITYVDISGNIWRQSISGGPPQKMTDYKQNGVFFWKWSLDGKQLAMIRGEETYDAVTLSGF